MRNGTRILLAFVIVILALAVVGGSYELGQSRTASAAGSDTVARTITAQGHGEVQLAPDQATLSLGAETKNAQVGVALNSNNSTLQSIIAGLKAKGIPEGNIQTSNISLFQDSSTGVYDVTQTLSVQVDDVNAVSSLLQSAVNAGANSSYGLSFQVKNPSAAHAAALRRALADARSRADTMARALGVVIAGVRTVTEGTGAAGGVRCSEGCGGGGGPVQTGQNTVSADVTVTYTTIS